MFLNEVFKVLPQNEINKFCHRAYFAYSIKPFQPSLVYSVFTYYHKDHPLNSKI